MIIFLKQNIVIAGIEYTIDMDIDILLYFFSSMKYRTYLLGKYHLVRIYNLCRTALDAMLECPEFKVHSLESKEMKSNAFGFYIAPSFFVAIVGNRFEAETRTM